ncbi:MAG: hypothetical protein WBF53_01375, partial [Litorimonas sp.]
MTALLKRWTTLGAALMGATLSGCAGGATEPPADDTAGQLDAPAAQATEPMRSDQITTDMSLGFPPPGEPMDAGESHDGHSMDTLPRSHRLAFMMGHVEAGLSLYRAGQPDMAAPHLLHPVSETHAAEREGLEELGFDAALFET